MCAFCRPFCDRIGTIWHTQVTFSHLGFFGVGNDAENDLGRTGEELAAEHLLRLGYEIVERNYRTRWGELDIVARAGSTLAFCEVKTRRAGGRAGGPFDAVGRNKQVRVRKMAGSWLVERRDRPYADVIRFDAIGVVVDGFGRLVSLEHLEGAF
jgi:putative endonuclease